MADEVPTSKTRPDSPLPGTWSLPMSMREAASRLGNMHPDTARRLLEPTGLIRISRKLWRVNLSSLDYTLRYRIEHGRPPPEGHPGRGASWSLRADQPG